MIREETGKIFPGSLRSGDVLDILLQECNAGNIHMYCDQEIKSITRCEDGFQVISQDRTYRSPLLVIATGGCSYPATGSAGDGYRFARDLGHSIAEIGPALTPVYIKDYPFPDLAGISFSGLDIALYRGAKQIEKRQGDVLFTHQGLSGPGILDLSRHILAGDILKLSFIPAKNREDLEAWLLGKTEEGGSKTLRSMLLDQPCSPPLPSRLISRILELSAIPADIKCAHLNRDMRILLIDNLTGFPLVVERLGGFDQAMVTRGGVSLKEVNPKTMESRIG